jgi:acyl-CoA hydrolase
LFVRSQVKPKISNQQSRIKKSFDDRSLCSVCEARAAIEMASIIIAQVNPNMPRTFGDGFLHISEIDYAVEVNDPLPGAKPEEPSPTESQIGKNIAGLIENGSCLQMGIGSIPNAALIALSNHERLGIHTEMFSDGLLGLIQKGVVTGSWFLFLIVSDHNPELMPVF